MQQAKSQLDQIANLTEQINADTSIDHPSKTKSTDVKHDHTGTNCLCLQEPWDLKEGVLLEQLEDLILVVELGNVDGRLPIQVLERAAVHG